MASRLLSRSLPALRRAAAGPSALPAAVGATRSYVAPTPPAHLATHTPTPIEELKPVVQSRGSAQRRSPGKSTCARVGGWAV
jgi:hypothetical protein